MTEENEGKKTRSPSVFTLAQIKEDEAGALTLTPLATGSTDKELMDEALKRGDGNYAVVNIRREFKVATETKAVIA